MDEEFKVKFTIDMGDTEKKVAKFKEDLKSTEKMKISPKIGDIGKDMNKVFNNIRQQNNKVQKSLFWSKEKKSEFHNFYKDLENRAYSSLSGIEKKYSNLAESLNVMQQQKLDLQAQIQVKDIEADDIKNQIDQEMAKSDIRSGNWEDLVKMKAEYDRITSMIGKYNQGAQTAQQRGDTSDYESWLRDIEKLKTYRDSIEQSMNNFKVGESYNPEGKDYEKIAQLQAKWEEVTKEAEQLDKELQKIESNPAFTNKTQQLQVLGNEYKQIILDLQQNPMEANFKSEDLQRTNAEAQNLANNLRRSGRELSANTSLTEKWNKMMSRLKSRLMFSFVSLINPANVLRGIWSGFAEQNEDVANTFKMISQNLIKVFEPAIRKIANWFFKIMQYVNVFTKSWFGVDLFDKSVLSSEETKKNMEKMNQLQASFDELNVFKEEDNSEDNQTVMDTTGLPYVDTSGLEKWANGAGKWIGDALNWALENPLQAAGLALGAYFGTKFLAGLAGKGISKLIGNILGTNSADAAGASGSLIASIFGKKLYDGAGAWGTKSAVTVGKALGGIALVAGGTALAVTQAIDAGSNWQDLTTGAKAAKVGLVGVGSAAAGLGAVMLGASGPVGWAVAAGVALVSFGVGMAQTQDGIDSVKKETENLAAAQEAAAEANNNYLNATNTLAQTMSNLEQLEQQTGLSGAALDEQVKNGTLSVQNMTSAQLQVYNAYIQNQQAIENLKTATEQKTEADHQAELQSLKTEAANAIEADSYDNLREKVVQAWKEGSISAEEAGDILSRALANADDETQRTFGESIPEDIRNAFDPDKYESGWRKFKTNFKNMMNDLGNWFSEKWQGLKDWWNGLWNKDNMSAGGGDGRWPEVVAGGRSLDVPSYDVGTNYVPNDQLAMVHKGEAIVPAKYNNSTYMNNSASNVQMQQTISAMTGEISALRNLIQQGIPVSGTFVQRGSDLVAVTEKAKNKRGNQVISNGAFAR